jgi:drug/metabolite transporter (DMT)-like permease
VELVLGLGAAITYGAADFMGGLASKRAPVRAVVLVSQVVGSGLIVAAGALTRWGPADAAGLGWGGLAGLCGAAGVSALYFALSAGRMSVVAPVTAVVAAATPVLFGLAIGERPAAVSLVGVAVALSAVALVSTPRSSPSPELGERPRSPPGAVGAAAGLAFGGFFVFLERAPHDSGLWPLAGARVASIVVVAAALVLSPTRLRPARDSLPAIAAAGLLDAAANVLYLLATRRGLLSLVAVLTSMYPASTVLLAHLVLGERLTRVRVAGLAAAAVGVALIALG